MKREEVLPARSASLSDPNVYNMLKDQMVDVKLNEAVAVIFKELMAGSSIDNKLTGHVKIANEDAAPRLSVGQGREGQPDECRGRDPAGPPTGGRSPATHQLLARHRCQAPGWSSLRRRRRREQGSEHPQNRPEGQRSDAWQQLMESGSAFRSRCPA